MTTAHSPGPWKAGGYYGALFREIIAADGKLVAAVKVKRYDDVSLPVPTPEGEANLRLILAAPEMLAILKQCRALLMTWRAHLDVSDPTLELPDVIEAIHQIEAIINRPEGENDEDR